MSLQHLMMIKKEILELIIFNLVYFVFLKEIVLGKTDGAVISHSKEIYKEHPVIANKGDLEEARSR